MANKVNFYKSDNSQELRDFYQILGISPTASEEEIKKAYREKARDTHPDLHPELDASAFQEVEDAKEVLTDKEMRASYDAARKKYQDKKEKTNFGAKTAPKASQTTQHSSNNTSTHASAQTKSTSHQQTNRTADETRQAEETTRRYSNRTDYTTSSNFDDRKDDSGRKQAHTKQQYTQSDSEDTIDDLLHRYADSPSKCEKIRKELLFDQIMSDFHLSSTSKLSMLQIPIILRNYFATSWDTMLVSTSPFLKKCAISNFSHNMQDYYFYPSLSSGMFQILRYSPIYKNLWYNLITGENLTVQQSKRNQDYTILEMPGGFSMTIFPLINIMPHPHFQNHVRDLTKAYLLGNECFNKLWIEGYVPHVSFNYTNRFTSDKYRPDPRIYEKTFNY